MIAHTRSQEWRLANSYGEVAYQAYGKWPLQRQDLAVVASSGMALASIMLSVLSQSVQSWARPFWESEPPRSRT